MLERPTHGRRLEIGWEIPLGEQPTTQYVVHLIRSAEQAERLSGGGDRWEFFG